MRCATIQQTYTCSNGLDTTCAKQAVNILSVDTKTACLNTDYVVLQYPEYIELTVETSPFHLDNESAVALVGATLLIWTVGYIFRQIIQTVRSRNESVDHEN